MRNAVLLLNDCDIAIHALLIYISNLIAAGTGYLTQGFRSLCPHQTTTQSEGLGGHTHLIQRRFFYHFDSLDFVVFKKSLRATHNDKNLI